MVIRHSEKPTNNGAPYGVTLEGEQDKYSLTVLGWQRAGALVGLFAPGPLQRRELAVPDYLYAAGSDKHSPSKRPEQTIVPLANRLNLKIDSSFIKGQEHELTESARSRSGVVLVSWEHKAIPDVAGYLLEGTGIQAPAWPEHRFDVIWVFDLVPSTGLYNFIQVTQQLLAGDTDSLI